MRSALFALIPMICGTVQSKDLTIMDSALNQAKLRALGDWDGEKPLTVSANKG